MTGLPPAGFQEWLAGVFDQRVRDDIFGGREPGRPDPVLVLLGGQPAAGKTRAQQAVAQAHGEVGLARITGDDLREYHPGYARLALEDPLGMPAATAPVSGGLVALALAHALERRYSVLLEGTFRDQAMVTATAGRFARAGYRVEVVAVAIPAAVSRLSAEMRSLDAGWPAVGRWTPPEAHEAAVANSAGVVSALEAMAEVASIQVRSRDALLFENRRAPDGRWLSEPRAAHTLRAEQARPLGPAEAADWLDRYEQVFKLALGRPGYLGEATWPAYRLLQADAEAMILASGRDGIAVGRFRERQRQRAARLASLAPG
ncbi:MAG: zeta toxin family protein, partial [Bifidobacteriaceae bacterium]|nr:zeta toxin family protein [Bifidobacteriaceae bacterium]